MQASRRHAALVATVFLFSLVNFMNAHSSSPEDPWLWLEEVEGPEALAWVEARNAESLAVLEAWPEYQPLFEKNLAVLDSQDRIAEPTLRGPHVYNFWRDAQHERGIWRRTSQAEYRKAEPAWETLIDLDALAAQEKENWVWSGAECLAPDYRLCMVELSRGGADATVKREFDITTRTFVSGGFELPEAKGAAVFLDADTLLISTDFGSGSMTESGYPRIAKLWRRGKPLAEAEVLFEGQASDIGVWAYTRHTPERDYAFVQVAPTFFTQQTYLYANGRLQRLPIPDDSELQAIFRNQLLISLKSDWQHGNETWPQGAVVSVDLDQLLAGEGRIQALVMPDPKGAVSEVTRTRDLVLVNRMADVRSTLSAFSLVDGSWREQVLEAPLMGQIDINSASEEDNSFYFTYTDFLTPSSLYVAEGVSAPTVLKSLPAFFDAAPYVVSQHFVNSSDGTRVPYFMVARKDVQLNGKNPTLIYAYGGFEVPITPGYSATMGMGWLELGGVYVVANIRGGGEYGPAWHRAAQRENRQKSYDDFFAVAEDLVARQVTSPRHLGIRGGSGGGLLVGMLFTQRPELFHAVVCQVPLLDMQRFNKLLAGASWVEEYGNPDDPAQWEWLQHYSPYHNLKPGQTYPREFFTTSTRDDRVHPGHARKMVAKMTAMGIPNLYYENTEGGHAGAANNRQAAKVQALIYAYLVNELR